MSVRGVVLEMRREAHREREMTSVDYIAPVKPRAGLRRWIAGHGLASAIIACAVFWAALGVALYVAF